MRQKYSPEFKAEAVKLVIDQKQPMAETSRNLKISIQTLSNWVTSARHGKLAGTAQLNPSIIALEAEVKRLKKALAVAEMEREILGKATAYFAKENLRGTRS